MMAGLDILNGFVSKVISDCIDISINAIKKADRNRKSKDQTLQTRIYQVTVDALNVFPYNKYKKNEKVYDAAECILKELKKGNSDYKESVRMGLNMISLEVTGDKCEEFLGLLHDEICREENRDLAIEHIIFQGEKIGEQQQQMDQHMQEGFEESHQNEKEILEEVSGVKHLIKEMNGEKGCKTENKRPIVNRADEYGQRWEKNVFLNDFNKRDKDAGENIKLRDIYLEEHLPNYKWKNDDEPSTDLKELLKEYILDNDDRKMLLILGQPGIGKSTLITWIMAHFIEKRDEIIVYQFALDLKNVNWQCDLILKEILETLNLRTDELKNNVLILDGFDEIHVNSGRESILRKLNQELERENLLKNFSLIITCRENYVDKLQLVGINYIILQAWNEKQIKSFCNIYEKKSEKENSKKGSNAISETKMKNILENKEIFGIPLILYMILALNITIEKKCSIVDVYDQIFSLNGGGIYDRCYDIKHRTNKPEIKKCIHLISQKIAFWIFEHNDDKAFIDQKNFKEICESVRLSEDVQSDILIGSYFKIKHCEGKLADEVNFIHRSIYEYFVTVYFCESISNLTSKGELAKKLGELLKRGILSKQILEFIKYKFDGIKRNDFPDVVKETFNIMIQDGMCYHMDHPYNNAIERERNIFANMLEIVCLWNLSLGKLNDRIIIYLQCNRKKKLKLRGIKMDNMFLETKSLVNVYLSEADLSDVFLQGVDLRGADLSDANLSGAYLRGVYLKKANLEGVNFRGADLEEIFLREANLKRVNFSKANLKRAYLRRANLSGANLSGANLSGANLSGVDLSRAILDEIDLSGAILEATIFNKEQMILLQKHYDLNKSSVLLSGTNEIISYQDYCL